ncbi:hypothetical protein Tco_1276283 [Tanacetum coccineum]
MLALIQAQQELLAQFGYIGIRHTGQSNTHSDNIANPRHVAFHTENIGSAQFVSHFTGPPSFPPQQPHTDPIMNSYRIGYVPPTQQINIIGQAQFSTQPNHNSGQSGSKIITGHETILSHAFSAMTLQDPTTGAWNIDTCASSHLNDSVNSHSDIFNMCIYPFVYVSDGYSIPVINTGNGILPTPHRLLHLNNVLITPNIVKKLIFVLQFVRDNNCTIEVNTFGFSIKYFMTRRVLLRCDSTGDLYPVMEPSHIPQVFITSQHMWHQRLGYPGSEVSCCLISSNSISCNKMKPPILCDACQLGST